MTSKDKPVVSLPDGPPPGQLTVEDIEEGLGEEAVVGSTVAVHYVGVSWSTRVEFDSSWERGEPLMFTVGKQRVIAGWEQGILGMRVGGRRLLSVPPSLGYGTAGAGLFIRPNETLVFVVDLIALEKSSAKQARPSIWRLFGRH